MSPSPSVPPSDPRAGRCSGCGAVLAADQRYCLSCGAPRDQGRLPFRDALAPEPAAVLAAGPPVAYVTGPAGGAPGGSPTLLTTLAALGCVLLAFGIGVLVGGRGDDGGSRQPIVLGGGAAAAPAATPTTTAAAAATDPAAAPTDTTTTDDTPTDAVSATPDKPKPLPKKAIKESAKALKDLDSAKSTDDYAKKSAKLPDVVVTGGDPGATK